MLMADMLKHSNQGCKLTPTTSIDPEKHQGDRDFENCSLSNFDLLNQKTSSNNLNLHTSDDVEPNALQKTNKNIEIINLESEESQDSQKIENKQVIDQIAKNHKQSEIKILEPKERIGADDSVPKQNQCLEPQTKYSILNSKTLNQKCSKCQSSLLCALALEQSSKWIQCLECLQMVHNPCEIQCLSNHLKVPVCLKCSLKKKPLLLNTTNLVQKKEKTELAKSSKKKEIMMAKMFKDKTESFMYLDAFLNGFSYKLAITDQQVKREIKILERKNELQKQPKKH